MSGSKVSKETASNVVDFIIGAESIRYSGVPERSILFRPGLTNGDLTMIIYGDSKEVVPTKKCIARILNIFERFQYSLFSDYDVSSELLIEFSEFESAISDKICAIRDFKNDLIRLLRSVGNLAGHITSSVWDGRYDDCRGAAVKFRSSMDRMPRFELPDTVTLSVPEGFAYYGVYPEMFIEAAKKFYRQEKPQRVVCIGLRSIGTGLCSVVSAELESLGCSVNSVTLRPRGEYFDRHLKLSEELKNEFRSDSEAYFILADEGPGLSGSSFCGTAEHLTALGIRRDKIVFFPTWEPSGEGLISDRAKQIWPVHKKFSVDFEEVWLQNGRLQKLFSCYTMLDISAGNWRSLFYSDVMEQPAVYPANERRKYLFSRKERDSEKLPAAVKTGNISRLEPILIKFVGLGKYGREVFRMAQQLSENGFCPEVIGFRSGFLAYRFASGMPMRAADAESGFLNFAARYLAFLRTQFPERTSKSPQDLIAMIRENLSETCGEEWVARFDRVTRPDSIYDNGIGTAVDGRMNPHEWIKKPGGFVKVDMANHHADIFFHGCQDIAWDIAGLTVEFALDSARELSLLNQYGQLASDSDVTLRYRFFKQAYIAFRLGYAMLASNVLDSAAERLKFSQLADYYAKVIKKEISES